MRARRLIAAVTAVLGMLAVLSTSGIGVAYASGTPSLVPAAGQYTPIAPTKVLDTRDGTGGVPVAPLAANGTATFLVTGVGSVPPDGVSDVYVVISAIGPTASGCLHDYNADITDPGICTVSFDAGNAVSDADIVQVGAGGYVSVTNASSGTVDVAVTVMGYYQTENVQAAGDTYVAIPEARLVDTRTGLGAPAAQIPGGGSLSVQITGQRGIPSDAAGAALYVGAANATGTGYVSAYPTGGVDSGLPILSYVPQRIVHDLYFGALSATGQLTLVNHGSAPVDLIVAAQGYLVSPSGGEAGSLYDGVPEARIVDTRYGTGGVPATPVPAGGSITFTATGVDGVPSSGVSAVAESVRAVNPTASGYLSIYPAGSPQPNVAAVNFNTGGNQGNDLTAALVSQVNTTGQQTITNNSSGTVDVVVAVRGYYGAPVRPDPPEWVDAGIQNGTATINWAAPDTDGGAAITSYVVTAYNPDGSVNQTKSVGPNVNSATVSGLTGAGPYSASVAAVNALGAGGPTTATIQAAGPNSGPTLDIVSEQLTMNVDWSAGTVSYGSSSASETTITPNGTTTTQSLTPDTADLSAGNGLNGSGFSCVINVNTGASVTAFPPWHVALQDKHVTVDFMNETYGIKNARTVYGEGQTYQMQLCATGGASPNTSNNRRLVFAGDASYMTRTIEYKIGDRGGTNQTYGGGSQHTTLNFSLAGTYQGVTVQIGANVQLPTLGNGTDQWDIGNDGRFVAFPSSDDKYWKNRANFYWITASNYCWDGSTSYEGNVGNILYEWPMSSIGGKITAFKTYAEAATISGC